MPTLPYAPPDPRSRRRRIVRWGLILAGLAALVAVTVPIFRLVQGQYDHWMMQRALAACLDYKFPEGVAAYAEGDAAIAMLRASDHAGSYRFSEASQPLALWQDTPWLKLTRSRAARLGGDGLARISAVVFLGEMKNPAGQRRLVVLSIAEAGRDVAMTAQVIDPNPPVPREIFNQWWAIERHRAEWPLSIDPGRVDPADPSVVTIALRFGGTDGTATLRLTDADTLTFSSTIGWAESIFQKWWLDAPEQDLATLLEKPELIPLFDDGAGPFASVAVARSEAEVVGMDVRGVRLAVRHEQGLWKARWIHQWAAGSHIGPPSLLAISGDGRQFFATGADWPAPMMGTASGGFRSLASLPFSAVTSAAFSPDGQRLYLCGGTGGVLSMALPEGRLLWSAPAGTRLLAAGESLLAVLDRKSNDDPHSYHLVRLLSAADGSLVQTVTTPAADAAVAVAPDGQSVAMTDSSWVIRDTRSGELLHRFPWPWEFNDSTVLQWLPCGNVVVAGGSDCVYFWDLRPPQTVYRLPVPLTSSYRPTMSLSPDGRFLVVAGLGATEVWLWDLNNLMANRAASDNAASQ